MMRNIYKSCEIEEIIGLCAGFTRTAENVDVTAFLNSLRGLFGVRSACLAQVKRDTLRPVAGFVSVGSDAVTIEQELSLFGRVHTLSNEIGVMASGTTLLSVSAIQNDKATAVILTHPVRPFCTRTHTSLRLVHTLIQPALMRNATLLCPITMGSRRVEQVYQELLNGRTDKSIASNLGISPHTVHAYVKQVFKLRGVNSRAELLSSCLKEKCGTSSVNLTAHLDGKVARRHTVANVE